MHLISHKEKSFYIHITKNGGHTICPLLLNKKWGQIPVPLNPKQIDKKTLKEYYVFTIVRNPYERFLSGWKSILMSRRKSNLITPEFFKKNYNTVKDKIHIGMTQTQHLAHAFNHLDKIYKFEDFKTAYDEINKKFECGGVEYEEHPKINASVQTNFDDYMDENVIKYINSVYDIDFSNFEYKKIEV